MIKIIIVEKEWTTGYGLKTYRKGTQMKKTLLAVVLAVCFALPAMAKSNSVNVAGDIVKDGKLTINVDWTIDSSKYPGLSREAIRDKVRQDIRDQVVPKIIAAAQGIAVSFDQSNFSLIKENTTLLQTRPDGSKIYTMNMQMEFNAPVQAAPAAAQPAAAAPAPVKAPKYETSLNQRWENAL